MGGALIDTTSYKAHSYRSASATDLVKKGLSLQEIVARAFWSPNSGTFARFYNRA